MGSGSNRKATDTPIIRKPKTVGQDSGGAGGGEVRSPEKIAEACIPSFEVKLPKSPHLEDGKEVSLQKGSDGTYSIILFGQKVGSLNKTLSEMVANCNEMSVGYGGKIVKKKNADEFLARFIRK